MPTTPHRAAASPAVTFTAPDASEPRVRGLGDGPVEIASHTNMSLGFDTHMRRRGDIDRHLTHLSVETEGLRFAVEALATGGAGDEGARGKRKDDVLAADRRLAAQLSDEVALLDCQIEAAQGLSSTRRNDIADLRSILAERRAAARKHFGLTEMRSVLAELSRVEERIRRLEDERLDLSQAAFARRSAAEGRRREAEEEAAALQEQRDDLARRLQDMEAEVRAARDAVDSLRANGGGGGGGASGASRLSPPRSVSVTGITLAVPTDASDASTAPSPAGSGYGGGMPPEVAGASETETMLRREIEYTRQDMAAIEEALARDGALLPDGSPRERLANRELPPSGLSTETLIRIMQLLKASLFNVSTDIGMIEATVQEIISSRDAAANPESWGTDLVGEALVSAARYVHQPYESQVAIAEKMAKRLRRLVLVCDTVDGLTADWVVDFVTRRGIGLEVSQFYEVAMECRSVILDARRRKQQQHDQRRQQAHSATKGKVFASLGMRRASQMRGSVSVGPPASRTNSVQPSFAFGDSDDGGNDGEEEEE